MVDEEGVSPEIVKDHLQTGHILVNPSGRCLLGTQRTALEGTEALTNFEGERNSRSQKQHQQQKHKQQEKLKTQTPATKTQKRRFPPKKERNMNKNKKKKQSTAALSAQLQKRFSTIRSAGASRL